jgi:hypothetical protein
MRGTRCFPLRCDRSKRSDSVLRRLYADQQKRQRRLMSRRIVCGGCVEGRCGGLPRGSRRSPRHAFLASLTQRRQVGSLHGLAVVRAWLRDDLAEQAIRLLIWPRCEIEGIGVRIEKRTEHD